MRGSRLETRRERSMAVLVVAGGAALAVLLVAALVLAVALDPLPPAVATPIGDLPTRVPGTPPTLALTAGQTPEPLASVTKVMTAYVVLNDHPLAAGQSGPEITISAADAATLGQREAQGQSFLPVKAGEQLSELQALEGLLVPSADNIADVLADFDAGSQAAFVAKMNASARALAMAQTSYADASGLDPRSRSTASDQILLARAAMAQPVLAQIVGMSSVTLPVAGKVANYNSLAGSNGFTGIKTGSTAAAGGCLVWSVTRIVAGTSVTLFGAVLGQRGSSTYLAAAIDAAVNTTTAAYQEFAPRTLLPAGTPVYSVKRAGQSTVAVTAAALTTVYPPGTPVRVTVTAQRTRGFDPRTGPVAQVKVDSPDATAADSTAVRLAGPLRSPSWGWRLGHVL